MTMKAIFKFFQEVYESLVSFWRFNGSVDRHRITNNIPDDLHKRVYKVKYDFNYHKLNYKFFPTILIPKKDTVIKPPQLGRNGNIGFSEKKFFSYVKNYFENIFNVSNDMCLFTKGKSFPYEPDITMWNIIDDELICIDVEIDEPYAGDGTPTHCKGYDIERNKDFLNRGWVIIRFSENQVVEDPEKCCKTIANVVSSLIDSYTIPKGLSRIKLLDKEPYWDENKSKELAKSKTREKLHNILNFGNMPESDFDNSLKDNFLNIEDLVEDQYSEYDYLIVPKGINNTAKSPKKPVGKPVSQRDNSYSGKLEGIKDVLLGTSEGEIGFDRNGLTSDEGIKPIPARHYGGKPDKRVFEMMKPKQHPFSAASKQKINIENNFDFLKCKIKNGKLVCEGKVHPEYCNEYELCIEYQESFVPKVYITKPEIKPNNKIHMYSDGSLCLFYPRDLKWKDNFNIATYFVPWSLEWIYCYEYYLLTGEWRHEEAPGHIIIDFEAKRYKDKNRHN